MDSDIQGMPIEEGFWTTSASPKEELQLIGSKCLSCGELFFPLKKKGWCVHCHRKTLENVKLNRKGKIVSFSVVMQQPGGGFYKGQVPYSYGLVELPEGIMIKTLFATNDFADLEVNGDVELVIDKLCGDDRDLILTFKFMPIKANMITDNEIC